VFLAEYSISAGDDLGQAIGSAIEECDLFILLWSTHAKTSEWVSQEIGIAEANGKAVMPVLLHKNLELPGFLKGLKFLELYKNPEKSLDWLQEHVFEKADKKSQKNGLIWLGLGAAVALLLSWSYKEEVSNQELEPD
jgi:hypothetical protein